MNGYAYYHVTREADLSSIMAEGLVPRIGPRSEKTGEAAPAVYLFPDLASLEDAMANWLGDEFPDDEPLAVLEVTMPAPIGPEPGQPSYERRVAAPIPQERIRRLDVRI